MSDLSYVIVSITHTTVRQVDSSEHGHDYYKWPGVPTGYKLHRVYYKQEEDEHIHIGLYIEESEPTFREAAVAYVKRWGDINKRDASEGYRDLYEAYQREEGEL